MKDSITQFSRFQYALKHAVDKLPIDKLQSIDGVEGKNLIHAVNTGQVNTISMLNKLGNMFDLDYGVIFGDSDNGYFMCGRNDTLYSVAPGAVHTLYQSMIPINKPTDIPKKDSGSLKIYSVDSHQYIEVGFCEEGLSIKIKNDNARPPGDGGPYEFKFDPKLLHYIKWLINVVDSNGPIRDSQTFEFGDKNLCVRTIQTRDENGRTTQTGLCFEVRDYEDRRTECYSVVEKGTDLNALSAMIDKVIGIAPV